MIKSITIFLLASAMIIGATESKKKPNILFVFADDMSLDTIGALGKYNCKTPHLDKLMERGASFTHSYNMGAWGGAVCTASRTMLNTGAFVNRCQSTLKSKATWSQYMKKAGYTTYMTGKWHVKADTSKVFDITKDVRGGMPKGSGYNRPLSPEHHAAGWKPWDKSQGGFWQGGTHWSEVVANNTIEFLETAKKDEHPFFMYIAFNATHDPRQSPKEYIDMYPLDSIKVPKNFLSNYPYDVAIGCNPTKLRDERLMPSPRTEYAVKVHRQEYFAIATHMDAQIGRIFEALEKSGEADNTYVIFTADHGLSVGHHGLVGKQSMYDHSMRVPFFIMGPGIKAGTKFDMPIYLQDAMATALDIADVEKPAHVEFNSVLPLIEGKKKVQYEEIYGKYIDNQRMIAKGDYKLIMYPKAQVTRLFNTTKDPDEMNDLAMNPEYAVTMAKLKANFLELQKSMGDTLDVDKPGAKKKIKKSKK
jgi:arylsulfatase A-like enzyme